jgi:hypothetical protein
VQCARRHEHDAHGRVEGAEVYGVAAGVGRSPQPARAAALVCDAPARARRGPSRHPGDAGALGPVHHADLHARARGAPACVYDRFHPRP